SSDTAPLESDIPVAVENGREMRRRQSSFTSGDPDRCDGDDNSGDQCNPCRTPARASGRFSGWDWISEGTFWTDAPANLLTEACVFRFRGEQLLEGRLHPELFDQNVAGLGVFADLLQERSVRWV